MKKTTFTLLLSLSCCWLAAQCPADITFSTQGQVDSFQINYPGCTQILGDVTIRESVSGTITNLDSLSQIDSIGGYLNVSFNDSLTSLSGLNSLTSVGAGLLVYKNYALTVLSGLDKLSSISGRLGVEDNPALMSLSGLDNVDSIGGDLSIYSNDALTSLSGLSNLASIGGYLWVSENDALTSLNGLDSLTSIGSYLEIGGNAALTSLSGLDNLVFIGELWVHNNAALTSLSGLDNLASIGGGLFVSGNAALTSLGGLENLTSVGGNLYLTGNAALTSLSGLDSLTSIGGNLHLEQNAALTSLSGLDSLTSVGGSLSVYGNAALTSLSGLDNIDPATITEMSIYNNSQLLLCGVQSVCNYLENGGPAFISDNAPGCNDVLEIAATCQFQCPLAIAFSTQSQVDSFQIIYPNCSGILGNVTISGSSITHLDSLFSLKKIGGHLRIEQTALIDLNGLNSLDSVKSFLLISGNPSLVELFGLENLRYVGWGGIPMMFGIIRLGIEISGNPVLTSLHSLKNVKSATCLTIFQNLSLTSLSGLDSLSYVGYCQDIYDAPDAKHSLRISGNANLSTLDGLNNLDTSVYEISISNNELLTSLSGLENLDYVERWYVSNNHSLSPCNILPLCTHLENGGPATISDNAPGCNSVAEVEAACIVSIEETSTSEPVILFSPNPANDFLQIQVSDNEKWEISLFDLRGRQVFRQLVSGSETIGLEDWPSGIYMLRAVSGERVFAGRFVKR